MLTGEFSLDAIVYDVRTADDLSCCRLLRRRTRSREIPLVVLLTPESTHHLTSREATKGSYAAVVSAPCAATELVRVLERVV